MVHLGTGVQGGAESGDWLKEERLKGEEGEQLRCHHDTHRYAVYCSELVSVHISNVKYILCPYCTALLFHLATSPICYFNVCVCVCHGLRVCVCVCVK